MAWEKGESSRCAAADADEGTDEMDVAEEAAETNDTDESANTTLSPPPIAQEPGDPSTIRKNQWGHRLCNGAGNTCLKEGTWGVIGGPRERCERHACKETMVDLANINNMCKGGCGGYRHFGFPGGEREYCGDCAPTGMFLIDNRKCAHAGGCPKQPYFNYKDKTGGLMCKDHGKLLGMIDVVTPRCEVDDCKAFACTGVPGKKPTRCRGCRVRGIMVKNPGRRCHCRAPATHGSTVLRLERCVNHKVDGDLNLTEHRACRSCGEMFILDENDECETCAAPATKERLVTQNKVLDYLDKVGLEGSQKNDTVIEGSPGLERPDRVYAHADWPHVCLAEVDEHQHSLDRGYTPKKERARMLRINTPRWLGRGRVYVRFNLDPYRPSGFEDRHRRVRCCPKDERLACLARVIQSVKDGNLPFTVEKGKVYVIYLYYDEWNDDGSGEVNWKIIVDDETEINAVEAEAAERAQP